MASPLDQVDHQYLLHEYAELGDVAEIRTLLYDVGCDPELQNEKGQTPLMLACIKDRPDVVDLLLDFEAGSSGSLLETDAEGFTALMHACKSRSYHIMNSLLQGGSSSSIRNSNNDQVVHLAVVNDDTNALDILQKHNVSLHTLSGDGLPPICLAARETCACALEYFLTYIQTLSQENAATVTVDSSSEIVWDVKHQLGMALLFAAQQGNIEMCETLLRHQADPFCRFSYYSLQSVPGFMAVFNSEAYVFMNNYKGININIRGEQVTFDDLTSQSPLHAGVATGREDIVCDMFLPLLTEGASDSVIKVCEIALIWSMYGSNKNIFKRMYIHLTERNLRSNFGHMWPPIWLASILPGQEEILEFLTLQGVAVEVTDEINGESTPLLSASLAGNNRAVEMLLENGANVNYMSPSGATALSVCHNQEIFKLLIKHGTDVSTLDATDICRIADSIGKEGVDILLQKGVDISLMSNVLFTSTNIEVLRTLLENGLSLDIKDEDGRSPLISACAENNVIKVNTLLNLGADINDIDLESTEQPIHQAATLPDPRLLQLCLNFSADVKSQNAKSETPLHVAAKFRQPLNAAILIENGASLNATDKYGFTPLHHACVSGCLELVKLFLFKHGMDKERKTFAGETPLDLAHAAEHIEIMCILTSSFEQNISQEVACFQSNHKISEKLEKRIRDIFSSIASLCLFSACEVSNYTGTPSEECISLANELDKTIGEGPKPLIQVHIEHLIELVEQEINKRLNSSFSSVLVGSVPATTKVLDLDEFDFTFELKDANVLPTFFDLKQELAMSRNVEPLLSARTNEFLFEVIGELFKPFRVLQESICLVRKIINHKDTPCITIQIYWHCKTCINHKIDVDITPTFNLKGMDKPKLLDLSNSPLRTFVQQSTNPFSMVISAMPSEEFVYDPSVGGSNWKITPYATMNFLYFLLRTDEYQFPPVVRVAKFIRDLIHPIKSKYCEASADPPTNHKTSPLISSYVLQESAFMELSRYPGPAQWTEDDIYDRLLGLFGHLASGSVTLFITGKEINTYNMSGKNKAVVDPWVQRDTDFILCALRTFPESPQGYTESPDSLLAKLNEYKDYVLLIRDDNVLEPAPITLLETPEALLGDELSVYYYITPSIPEGLLQSVLVRNILSYILSKFERALTLIKLEEGIRRL